jgi:hypothetical protein
MDDQSVVLRVPRKWIRIAMIAGVTALVVAPLTAIASHSFTDVPDSNTFHADIDWAKDAGVTKGCNPPANTLYCPKDFVTREQMSAFMHRLADNQVVDAATIEGKGANDLVSPIVISSPPSDWVVDSAIGTVSYHSDRTDFIGGPVYLALPTPSSLGGVGYGLDSLEICYQAAGGSAIGSVQLFRSRSNGFATSVFNDLTSRSSTTFQCFVVNPDLLPGKGLTVALLGGTISLGGVTATWTNDTTGFD